MDMLESFVVERAAHVPEFCLQPQFRTASRPQRARILMVSPDYFCVSYAINPWMNVANPVDAARAQAQWQELREVIGSHADVVEMPGVEGLPDMCFSANGGLAADSTFVHSNFRHAERRAEAAWFSEWLRRQGFAIRRLPSSVVFEGAGDALFDSARRLWMGHGQRSDLKAAGLLSAMLDTQVIPLALQDEHFYHLDTCFCPLASGHVVFYPNAFTPESLEAIRYFVPARFRIPVSREDAFDFACNMIDLGDTLVMHRASADLRKDLNGTGHDVRTVDLSEFIKAGGGAKCLTLKLN
jgi:N-dimethylarginine dimethylaminohydrolase